MLSISTPLHAPPGGVQNWTKFMKKYRRNQWAWEHCGPSRWLCRQPYQMANEWNWPKHLNRYGFPRHPRTPGHLRPDRDRAKYCNMSSVHNQDYAKRGIRQPDHVVNSIGPDCESGHALLKSRDIKYVRSYI
ncbi:unnamed protein product [Amoebophrya sp. A25]|nr:unnamed protein product [Amoebophrya sp. A25]|eukprot:GSA25T00011870001.1